VKNLSKKTWLRSGHGLGNVNLGAHLFDDQGQMLDHDFYRYHFLVEDCLPGASVNFSCSVPWPSEMENFVLEFDLVSEQICWFAFNGSKTEKLTIAKEMN
ncbi:MAG: hypothetical protein Q8Q55_02115, partial [Undibacterium sp.]|nr:hypothetical protein [Undibacterium sp.]